MITDHYPLIPILNNHRLDEIENPCLQRLKTKLMGYNFTAEYNAPDVLSRNPVADPTPQDILGETELDNTLVVSTAEVRAVSNTEAETLRIHNLKQIAAEDSTYQKMNTILLMASPHTVDSYQMNTMDIGGHEYTLPSRITSSCTAAVCSSLCK